MDKELLSQQIDDTIRRAHLPMQTLSKKIPLFTNNDISFTDDKVYSLREPSEIRIKKELDIAITPESHKKAEQFFLLIVVLPPLSQSLAFINT